MRFTISDSNGQSKVVEQAFSVSGVPVSASADWDISGVEQHAMEDSTERTTYRDPCYMKVYAELSRPVGSPVTVTVEIQYRLEHCGFYNCTATRITDRVSVVIPAGQTKGSAIARQYTEYCYIDNESYPHVLVVEGDRIDAVTMTPVSAYCSDPSIDVSF